jgi:inosose dehydratase
MGFTNIYADGKAPVPAISKNFPAYNHERMLTRRKVLSSAFAAPLALGARPRALELSVEGYIFQQYAQRNKKSLADVIPETLGMARAAGFRNIELNSGFFTPEIRDRTISLLHSLDLQMPSIYVGGAVHTEADASRTIASALEYARLAAPFHCKAVVTNPDPKSGGQTKTDAELAIEAKGLNRMARVLADQGFELRVHHHTPQLENNAREWRYILAHTDPKLVRICVDVDWAYEGGFAPVPFLREAGSRVREIHVRSARNKVWLESVEDSDIDYKQVATYLEEAQLDPLVVVELAYRPQTIVTRSLEEDLRLSRIYTERVFGIKPIAR